MLSERLDEKQRSEILFNLHLFSFRFKTQFSFSRLKFNYEIRKDHCTTKTTCKIWDTPTTLSRSYLTPTLFCFEKPRKDQKPYLSVRLGAVGLQVYHIKTWCRIQYRPKSRFKYSTTMHKNNFKERMQFSLGLN